MSIVFKAKLEQKQKEHIFGGLFLQKPKTCFFRGSKKIVGFKTQMTSPEPGEVVTAI